MSGGLKGGQIEILEIENVTLKLKTKGECLIDSIELKWELMSGQIGLKKFRTQYRD